MAKFDGSLAGITNFRHAVISNMAQPRLKLEAFLVAPDGSSEYRFLVNRRHTKYVLVDADALPTRTLINFACHPQVLGAALPPFPAGEWNIG